MNVLHVSNVDLYGRRFNGYDLMTDLEGRGVSGKQAVISKLSHNPSVIALAHGSGDDTLQSALARVEERYSMNNLLFPWGRVLAESREFESADVVHYHLLHNQVVSLLDLPMLTSRKPSVWTFHDPWPLTGHCIYPQSCPRWTSGCQACPRLDAIFAMKDDCADRMWRVKQRVYSKLDVDIVVASKFMLDMVERSPLTAHFEHTHLIPFGIDPAPFLADDQRAASRRLLGIPEDDFVLFFRSTPSEVKGLKYIIEALAARRPTRPTTLLTVDRRHLIGQLSTDYNIVELGWVEDASMYPRLFSACDIFLMPSTAEAFGLMALEAMAAGRPVVCFEGTSLPSVTHAPECGVAVPLRDSAALRAAIDELSGNADMAAERGRRGRELAVDEYSHERYLDALTDLYRSAARRTR